MKKKYLLILLAIILVGFSIKTAWKEGWEMGRQHEGVCIELDRPLTDDEKIRAVIEMMNRAPMRGVKEPIPGSKGTGYYPRKRIPFASVDDFLKENPNCCSVEIRDKHYNEEESWGPSKASGAYAGHVTVNYTLHYLDENGIARTTPDTMVWTIQNCGVVN